MNDQGCIVNHRERREMGLLRCYACDAELQTIWQANEVRRALGLDPFVLTPKGPVIRRRSKVEPWRTAAVGWPR